MNIDLLQDNPDWRWYLLFGFLSLLLTGLLWSISKCAPVSTIILIYTTDDADIRILAKNARKLRMEEKKFAPVQYYFGLKIFYVTPKTEANDRVPATISRIERFLGEIHVIAQGGKEDLNCFSELNLGFVIVKAFH